LANLTLEPIDLKPARIDRGYKRREWTDLIQGWTAAGAELGELQLAPYQVMWLAGSRIEPDT